MTETTHYFLNPDTQQEVETTRVQYIAGGKVCVGVIIYDGERAYLVGPHTQEKP
jgi:hypothetical protein